MAHISRRMQTTRSRCMLLVALSLAIGTGVAGCGQAVQDGAAGTPAATTASTGADRASTSRSADATPPDSSGSSLPKGVSTATPGDPLASSTVTPVPRRGKKGKPRVRTKDGVRPFGKPVAYTDGLRLTIARMTQGAVTGEGPGVFPGRVVTGFEFTLTNGTTQALPLDVVVITVTYGSPARVARAVYDQNSLDFTGPVPAGQTAKAVYGFSIPAAGRGKVTMTVDIDGVHEPAVFKGKVK